MIQSGCDKGVAQFERERDLKGNLHFLITRILASIGFWT